jgi:hypothetical protein
MREATGNPLDVGKYPVTLLGCNMEDPLSKSSNHL